MRPALLLAALALAGAWGWLYLSSQAVLISSTQWRPPTPGAQEVLTCRYFTGAAVIEREFWYSAGGVFGLSACPRLLNLTIS
jgi:hypothetical protein